MIFNDLKMESTIYFKMKFEILEFINELFALQAHQ